MSSNVGSVVLVDAGLDEGARAFSDLSAGAEFLCLRVTALLARAEAAPEDTKGSEPALRLLAIEGISLPKFQLILRFYQTSPHLPKKSFYQFDHRFTRTVCGFGQSCRPGGILMLSCDPHWQVCSCLRRWPRV